MRQEEFVPVPVVTFTSRDVDAIYEELGNIVVRNYSTLLKEVKATHGEALREDEKSATTIARHFRANEQRLARFRYGATTRTGSLEDHDWKELVRRVDTRDVTRLSMFVGDQETEVEVQLSLVGTRTPSFARIRSEREEDVHRYRGFFADLFRRRRDAIRESLTTGLLGTAWRAAIGGIPALVTSLTILDPLDAADVLLAALATAGAAVASWVLLGRLLDQAAPRIIIEGWGPSPRPRQYLVDFALSVLAGAVLSLAVWLAWG